MLLYYYIKILSVLYLVFTKEVLKMYDINDTVLYGANGICKISDICEKDFSGTVKKYYLLRPLANEGMTIFVPVENKTLTQRMRRILSTEEIYDLIGMITDEPVEWIVDDTERKEHYRAILSSGDRRELLKMIRELYLHKQEQQSKGRKNHISDEQFLKEAEKLLYSEFSLVLNIKPNEVPSFIAKRICANAKI